MTAVTETVRLKAPVATRPRRRTGAFTAVSTLARRRLALTARTPRELLIPLLAPLLFAVVVAPALADTVGATLGGVDYMTFVAVATIGLLVPLSCMQAGLGVLVDRLGGGLRDLLAAVTLRGAEFDLELTGVLWFAAAVVCFTVAMYGVAEVLANRIPTQEEYIGALPPVAIVPFFFAGSFFPISALPAALTAVGKALPITHVLALMRYGLVDRSGSGLRDIWGMSDPTTMAALSLGVVALFAVVITAVSIRVFQRTAVQ